MTNSSYTFESLVRDALRRDANALSILNAILQAATAQQDKALLSIENQDGTTSEFSVPSFTFLSNEINRISNSLDTLSGVNTNAFVRGADGKYSRLVVSDFDRNPEIAPAGSVPSNFVFNEDASFLDGLIFPAVFYAVRFDSVDVRVQGMRYVKYSLNLDTDSKRTYYENTLKGNSVISFEDFESQLIARSIGYLISEETVMFPPSFIRYQGNFDVLNIEKRSVVKTLGTSQVTTEVLVYKLNTIFYEDKVSSATKSLSENDILILPGATASTKYRIDTIDRDTAEVTLTIMSGTGVPGIGVDVFTVDGPVYTVRQVEVPIRKDENVVVFFRSISQGSSGQLISPDYSPGVAFTTNELTIETTSGSLNLPQFYNLYVTDISSKIVEIAREKTVTLAKAITPIAPIVVSDNFKVDIVNTHVSTRNVTSVLRDRLNSRQVAQQDLVAVETQLSAVNQRLLTQTYSSTALRVQDEARRRELIEERNIRNGTLESVTSEIGSAISRETFSPKYRIRGFWDIPEPVYEDSDNRLFPQYVIGFEIQYRYLNADGEQEPTQQLEFVTTNGTEKKTGSFSRWNKLTTGPRRRTYDQSTGQFTWEDEIASDGDAININQLDIPISDGEQVEIRIRSISEAGYPNNPIFSGWSSSIFVDYPPEETTDATRVLETAAMEAIVNEGLKRDLTSRGVFSHLDETVEVNGDTFLHSAKSIITDFRTNENNPIGLQEYLNTLSAKIDDAISFISNAQGEIKVSILDSTGVKIADVSKNSKVQVFGGFYTDEVSSLTVKKGAIISKVFFIQIENVSSADLSLISYVPGSINDITPDSSYTGYLLDKPQYDNYRQYNNVPVGIEGLETGVDVLSHYQALNQPFKNVQGFQSGQVRGQFIYSRYRDIALNDELYGYPAAQADDLFLPISSAPGSSAQAYVWNYSNGNTGGGDLTNFCVHVDHPDLQAGSTFLSNFNNLYGSATGVPNGNIINQLVQYPYFSHSHFFNLEETDVDGQLQLGFRRVTKANTAAGASNFPRKLGFLANDQYLIGKNTCGSYLYLAPSTYSDIRVDGTTYLDTQVIKQGDSFAVRIPVIFEYRMTDYNGTGNTGTGEIGGVGAGAKTNLRYRKKIGLDITTFGNNIFSFDLEVYAQYRAELAVNLGDRISATRVEGI